MKLKAHVYIALLHVAGSAYETITLQSFTQRLVRRKVANVFRAIKGQQPLRSWEDGRVNTPTRAPQPSTEECLRLNTEAARSI